ncbi:MAG: hypothetical protein PVI01_15630, partial [Gemmatimonadales bacterium]
PDDAAVITSSRELADYYEALAAATGEPKAAANWIMKDVLQHLGEHGIDITVFPIPPDRLAGLIRLHRNGTINSSTARGVFAEMVRSGRDANAIVSEKGLAQIGDPATLEPVARNVLASHPHEVAAYKAGKTKILQFFVGEVMKATRGKADPVTAEGILRTLLDRPHS